MDTLSQGQSGPMFYFKRAAGIILLLALSATFFYSAYTKCGVQFVGETYNIFGHKIHGIALGPADNSFDSFQWTFLDLGVSNMLVAGIIARIMIGLELLLGLFLLCHLFLKKFTYKAVIAILAIFIVYLLVVIAKQGNSGNCGCFGDKVAMKPLTAIWKNVIMIAATIGLMFIYPAKPYKHQDYISLVVGAVAFVLPFLVNPVYLGTAPAKYDKPLNLELLYKYDDAPKIDLRKGKHIIAFMSLTCPHCKKAAYLMQIIHKQHPEIPLHMVLDGSKDHEQSFFDETHAKNVPYTIYRHTPEFIELAGQGVPSIIWVNNGKAELKSVYAYYQLDPKYMIEWMNAK